MTFTTAEAARITRLTQRQLQWWDVRGYVKPARTAKGRGGPDRVYSEANLLGLLVLQHLREHGLRRNLIRKVTRSPNFTRLSEYCDGCLGTYYLNNGSWSGVAFNATELLQLAVLHSPVIVVDVQALWERVQKAVEKKEAANARC